MILIPLINDEIYTFKLVTGEEVVAKVADGIRNDWYEVSKPCTVMADPSGKVSMVPSPLTMELDKNVLREMAFLFIGKRILVLFLKIL